MQVATGDTDRTADLVLLGGGGAAVMVLQHLTAKLSAQPVSMSAADSSAQARRRSPLRVVVVDPVDRLNSLPADRTWCSWWDVADPHLALLEPSIAASWQNLSVIGADGRARTLHLGSLRYVMVRSHDLYAQVATQASAVSELLTITHVRATVNSVDTSADHVIVETSDGTVTAQVALDSRPSPPDRAAATVLLQHFRGEVVTDVDAANRPSPQAQARGKDRADTAVFMDFSLPQPPVGVAFGYRLPAPDGTTLVEYTEFSPAVLDDAEYAVALGDYRTKLGLVMAETRHTEQGVIVMDDALRSATAGDRTVRIGGPGGATRGSTGYAFAAMQRQGSAMASAIVAAHTAGLPLTAAGIAPPRAYPRRHVWMDAVMLRALANNSLNGVEFFVRLFDRNPPSRVLHFLDGSTTPSQEIAIMATLPVKVMAVSAIRHAVHRARSVLSGT